MSTQKSFEPVAPSGMTIVFSYVCPACGKEYIIPEPTQPAQIRCQYCSAKFPILPVEDRTLAYIHLMLDEGRAAVDTNFA